MRKREGVCAARARERARERGQEAGKQDNKSPRTREARQKGEEQQTQVSGTSSLSPHALAAQGALSKGVSRWLVWLWCMRVTDQFVLTTFGLFDPLRFTILPGSSR